jgi:hypothetical protein
MNAGSFNSESFSSHVSVGVVPCALTSTTTIRLRYVTDSMR